MEYFMIRPGGRSMISFGMPYE